MNCFSDEIMTKWSWIVQRNDPKIVKWAIGSQHNKVDPRVATAILFVYRTRQIYSKAYQGKSNPLTSNNRMLPGIANMITIGFFFLWHSREHTVTIDNKPFKLSNVQFYQDNKPVLTQTSKLLYTANLFLPYLWHTENSVNGECIGHGHFTSATLCPIQEVAHWVAHLNFHKAKPHQPLYSYYHTASKA